MPTPYYERGGVTIYHGDCREILPTLTGDTLICDPPYGFGLYVTDRALLTHCIGNALAAFRTAAIFGYPELLVSWCRAWERTPDEWVTWWASNAMCKGGLRSKPLPREQEAIAIFGECPGADLMRRPRTGSPSAQRIRVLRGGPPATSPARLGDVWVDASPGLGFNAHKRLHPNEKPAALLARLVTMCSLPGDTVIDPTMGSGTALLAALLEGRRAVGIEIEERYCEVAARRCERALDAAAGLARPRE